MTPEENCRRIEKMLRVRQLELRGATEGERTAATEALGRLLTAFGEPNHAQVRAELDVLQERLNRAPPGTRLTPMPPHPVVQVVVVVQACGTSTSTTSTSTATGWSW